VSSPWKGIPPASRGLPQIECILIIDANGMSNRNPQKDKGTGKRKQNHHQANSGLTEGKKLRHGQGCRAQCREDPSRVAELAKPATWLTRAVTLDPQVIDRARR